MHLKIGQLAKRTGITVRALRHYDDIALLTPSIRLDNGYRLYDQADVARLYRIQALRRLDLSLADIQAMLQAGAASMPDVVASQIDFLGRQIDQAAAQRDRLQALQAQLHMQSEPSIDDWLGALESMAAGARYFTGDELALLRARVPEAHRQNKAALIARLKQLLAQGAAADTAEARALAQDWIDMLLDETGGDEGLLMKLYSMHWNEPTLHALGGIDREAMQFISDAMAHNRLAIYARYCDPDELARIGKNYLEQTPSWPPLISALREQRARGIPAGSAQIRPLALQWRALSLAKAGGDLQLQRKLQQAFDNEAALRRGSGIDAGLMQFVTQAIKEIPA